MSTTGTIGYGFAYSKSLEQESPMSEGQARDFTREVRDAVEYVGGTILFQGQGFGEWEGETEPAGSTTFSLPNDPTISAREDTLRTLLARIGYSFGQDCIALTFGDTFLIDSQAF